MARTFPLTLCIFGLAWTVSADAAGTRKSIGQLSSTELASLRRGVAQMKAWDNAPAGSLDYRRSWIYWANMHRFFGPGCSNPAGLSNPGMTGLSGHQANSADQQMTWCKCEHGTLSFLTWHRMYMFFFEKVLQAAAGDPNLRVPYWNYAASPKLPLPYRQHFLGSGLAALPNPLYTEFREAGLNAGTAAIDPAVASSSQAMGKATYAEFSNELEDQPHGAVHCATGVSGCSTGYMGHPASAANDPIFYSHHSNIDRLYECWLSADPAARLPTGALLNATFSFPDATGAIVTRRVGDMLTTSQLGYDYGPAPCGLQIRHFPIPHYRRPFRIPIENPAELRSTVTVVPLRLNRGQMQNLRAPAAARLNIEGITAEGNPEIMYRVVLRQPSGRRTVLGVLSFFTEGAHDGDRAMVMERSRRLDLPRIAPAQLAASSVVFEPTTGLVGAQPSALVRRSEAQRAVVRIRSLSIEFADR